MVVGGMRGCGGHAWLWGVGVCGCGGLCIIAGVCMVAGGMYGCRGCVWLWGVCVVAGACMVVGGGVREILRDTVNELAVRILLECILVYFYPRH